MEGKGVDAMRGSWKEWALAGVIAWLVPWFMVGLLYPAEPSKEVLQEQTLPQHQETVPEPGYRIPVLHQGKEVKMDLTDYLTGVLLGEMPSSFSSEAKKAQAVVARTYALRTVQYGGKHPGLVCTNSGCCQNWCDPANFADTDALRQAREAVESTNRLVLTYEGKLIEATYFSCSGGRTEEAVAVWGTDVPYLQSVESPGEESADHFRDTVLFSTESFLKALGLSGTPAVSHWQYTDGGGVASVEINGKEFSGTELRKLLNLRSASFSLEVLPGEIRITTSGYGHRVGMSQYGAQAMAMAGKDFQSILQHYYPGTDLAITEE